MKMKNPATGETVPAHLLGQDEDGKPLYQGAEGWVLTTDEGVPVAFDYDRDGNVTENTDAD